MNDGTNKARFIILPSKRILLGSWLVLQQDP